jgi:hypothetical protein
MWTLARIGHDCGVQNGSYRKITIREVVAQYGIRCKFGR